jgi:uncharacterized protein
VLFAIALCGGALMWYGATTHIHVWIATGGVLAFAAGGLFPWVDGIVVVSRGPFCTTCEYDLTAGDGMCARSAGQPDRYTEHRGGLLVFTNKACERLRHYVYLYINPEDDRPFYVGKGQSNRCFSHMKVRSGGAKSKIIKQLSAIGKRPRIDILKYGLTESEAFLVESTAIDLLNIESLANEVRGSGSRIGGRGEVGSIAEQLNARPVEITHTVILININREYRPSMDLHQLYDATRSAWKLGSRRLHAKYALAVYRGVVREVFDIQGWLPGGSTMKLKDRDARPRHRSNRWEFVGQVAEDRVRLRYKGKSVADYFKPGAQNPIQYVNC